MAETTNKISANLQGVGFLVLGMLIFSLQDIVVKWIGGNYSVLEIVTFRSLVALPLTLLFCRCEGGRGLPTPKRHKLAYVGGLF
jgi:drug/metabolite transporter (DMT)-like permease